MLDFASSRSGNFREGSFNVGPIRNHVQSVTIDRLCEPKEVLVTNQTDCNASRNTRTCATSRTRSSATNRTSLAENIRTWALGYGRLRELLNRTAPHVVTCDMLFAECKSADVHLPFFFLSILNRWHRAQIRQRTWASAGDISPASASFGREIRKLCMITWNPIIALTSGSLPGRESKPVTLKPR